MLDIGTLNRLFDLSASTLYELELKCLKARLSREEQAVLIGRARNDDHEARQALILHCLLYTLFKAYKVYNRKELQHIDVLDLAQEASVGMLEAFEKALEARDPVAYLLATAVSAMRRYCVYDAPLIQRPHYSMTVLRRVDPSPAVVESLDEPEFADDHQQFKVDLIEAPALYEETESEQRREHRFAPLYEAVKQLVPQQRATIVRRYGLFGQPAETLSEIVEASHLKRGTVSTNDFNARKNLAKALEEELSQMLRPKPALEED